MLTDAAASQTPITVNELLARSEKLALNDAAAVRRTGPRCSK